MKLEINLVKTKSIDSKMGKLLSRSRYLEVSDDTKALDAIVKFLQENISNFTAMLTDQRLVGQIQSIQNLTINQFACLRYLLASRGLDIWVYYVADNAENASDIEANNFEYNILDRNTIVGSFLPMCTKVTQGSSDNSMVKLYNHVIDAYGLFEGSLFTGMTNPLRNMIEAMKSDETVLGTPSPMKTTYVNSILDFLNKDIRVLTD